MILSVWFSVSCNMVYNGKMVGLEWIGAFVQDFIGCLPGSRESVSIVGAMVH